jgi:hypothetical protein
MSDNQGNFDPHFLQLVLSLQAGAMQQMGKIVSAVSGQIERDLELARHTIDILGMVESKTKGNLTQEESRLLNHVLYELRMNFVDESKKGEGKSDTPAGADQTAGAEGDKGPEK